MNDDYLWRDRAACKDISDPDVFFPERRANGKIAGARLAAQINRALKVCNRCPVVAQCKASGIGEVGIWGGTVRLEAPHRATRPAATTERKTA